MTTQLDATKSTYQRSRCSSRRAHRGQQHTLVTRTREHEYNTVGGRDDIHGTPNCRSQVYSLRGTVEVPLSRIKSTATNKTEQTVATSRDGAQRRAERPHERIEDESERCNDVHSRSKAMEVPLSRIKSTASPRRSRRRSERGRSRRARHSKRTREIDLRDELDGDDEGKKTRANGEEAGPVIRIEDIVAIDGAWLVQHHQTNAVHFQR
ncbi:hypothetical protein AB1N83_014135 [Pleurotus pulmonarius]